MPLDGLTRIVPSNCHVDKKFVDNGKFTGALHFKDTDKTDGSYRTLLFPFAHSGRVYSNSNNNCRLALYRLRNCRESSLQLEVLLKRNQKNTLSTRFFRRSFARLQTHVTMCLAKHEAAYGDILRELINKTHPKQRLRLLAYADIYNNSLFNLKGLIKKVTAKVKRDEWAKEGKLPRIINDLTTIGSLMGPHLAEFLKDAMASFSDKIGELETKFVKSPDLASLTSVFNKLINVGGSYFCYFSDDSCFATDCTDGRLIINLDIASCDASHGEMIFEFLRLLVSELPFAAEIMDGLIHQLTLPLHIKNSDNSLAGILRSITPTLFSGSALTTITNNVANFLIALSISKHLGDKQRTKAEMREYVVNRAKAIGYIVTCDVCERNSDIQFLKHSPDLSGRPCLNAGVILRSFGVCRGDLPGRGDVEVRARKYCASLVKCYTASGKHEITDILAEKFPRTEEIFDTFASKHLSYQLGNKPDRVNYHSYGHVQDRYRLDPDEYATFLSLIKEQRFNSVIYHACLSKILEKDYGLTCPTDTSSWVDWNDAVAPPPL